MGDVNSKLEAKSSEGACFSLRDRLFILYLELVVPSIRLALWLSMVLLLCDYFLWPGKDMTPKGFIDRSMLRIGVIALFAIVVHHSMRDRKKITRIRSRDE
ncbi:hypothetical protein Pla52n_41070 [Stieleria varia]|uniref:Uncharacterized protein n=1 Tax=Stieleria varia TaxID=2528005 RepID=A0A5C6ATU9_9BACT|nr:hypothetical protein Pla52n_41070 [Stieleria varia]